MTAADRARAAADRGRRVVDALGLRETTVTVVVEQWSGPVGVAASVLQSAPATTLVPNPRVVVTAWTSSAFGGGAVGGRSAPLVAATVAIGPITPSYPGGGYDADALDPAPSDPSQRVYLVLAGGAFDPAGERFVVTRVDKPTALRRVLTADRAPQD